MSTPLLNNTATQDNYIEALTVVFTYPKSGFALNVANAAIYYRLLLPGPSGQANSYVEDSFEHYLVPSLTNFGNPADEGFAGFDKFAGVKVRSAVAGTPGLVTVI